MYHFAPHEKVAIQGVFGNCHSHTSNITYSASMDLLSGSSSNHEEKLKCHYANDETIHSSSVEATANHHNLHQLILETKPEISEHLMHANTTYEQFMNPATLSDHSMLGVLNMGSFNSAENILCAEIPPDNALLASAMLHDPSMHLDLTNLHSPLASSGLISGSRASWGFGVVTEEGCGMKIHDNPQLVTRKQKRGQKRMQNIGGLKNEKQRRERLGQKFDDLRAIIPNTTRTDRASTVADTIDYINELLRTVKELKVLVEQKRLRRDRNKKMGSGDEVAAGDAESSSMVSIVADADGPGNGILRSSWIQRKSKGTFLDVRIVEDEVTIKLTQRRKTNCLYVMSKVLDELHLELLHLSGGNIGDCDIFMFNTKIHEGFSVYASGVAKKVIEVLDVSCPASIVG